MKTSYWAKIKSQFFELHLTGKISTITLSRTGSFTIPYYGEESRNGWLWLDNDSRERVLAKITLEKFGVKMKSNA